MRNKSKMLPKVDPRSLAFFLIHEHPQTIAVVFTQIEDHKKRSEILRRLPAPLAVEVLARLGNLDRVNPVIFNKVMAALDSELAMVFWEDALVDGGVAEVADSLKHLERAELELLLNGLRARDTLLANEIEKWLIEFEGVKKLA